MPGFIIMLFSLITTIINNSTKTILTEIYIITMIITVIFYQIVALVYSLNILKNYSIIDAKFYGDFDQTVAEGLMIEENRIFYVVKDNKTHKITLLKKDEIVKIEVIKKTID